MILSFLRVYIGRSKYSGKISSYILKSARIDYHLGEKNKGLFNLIVILSYHDLGD